MRVGIGPRWRPALNTSVVPIRSIQRPSATNGDWCTCPHSTIAGSVLLDPRRRGLRRRSGRLPGPARRRLVRRRVVHPDPQPVADERGVVGELPVDVVTRPRPVPPRAHGHHDIVSFEAASVDEHARRRAASSQPAARSSCSLRALRSWLPEHATTVVFAADAREVLEHHGDLRVGLDGRRDVEVVAGDDHEVVVARRPTRPSRAASACSADRRPAGCASRRTLTRQPRGARLRNAPALCEEGDRHVLPSERRLVWSVPPRKR